MKIVQSLWSKPGQKREGQEFSKVNSCSWPDKKYNYMSWALSSLQFRKFYDKLELVTDRAGCALLVDKLQLPYTDVKVVLDELNTYHRDLWALGKIFAYSIQDEPFIHADGDVYIWKKFDEDFSASPLLCQCMEEGRSFNRMYSTVFLQMSEHFEFYPEVFDRSIRRNDGIKALNMGIVGGHNIEFYKYFTAKAFEFIRRNISHLHKVDVGLTNIVFEQFLYYALAEEEGKEISFFTSSASDKLDDCIDFSGVPSRTTYIHMPGSLKRNKYLVDCLELRLQKDYPEYYYRIIDLLKAREI